MKCILDTNVPVKAACVKTDFDEEEEKLIQACNKFIHEFIKNPDSKLVLDMDWEIANEYRRNIKDEGMGQQFLIWLNTYMARMDVTEDMIKLERQGDEYVAFPKTEELKDFDLADRKFIALALSHKEKPPIIQAADGKWLAFKDVLKNYGINIEFLEINYAISKYDKKIRKKRH